MQTRLEHLDVPALSLQPRARAARQVAGAGPRVATSGDSWISAKPIDAGTAAGPWLVITTTIPRYSDRTAELRRRALSYRAERPADPALARAVNDALRFIDLIPATATLPQVALADDGEVNFFWRGAGLLIDIGFVGDGMMHYYVSDEAQGVDADDSTRFGGRSLPPDILTTMPRRHGKS